jgi:transportin-3
MAGQPEAWGAADTLLREERPAEVHFFAAQTMRKKVQRAFHELPAAAHTSLRDSLVAHLARFTAGPPVVAIQLACAFADLALQMMPAWTNPIGDVMALMKSQAPGVLLDILAVVPEELLDDALPISVGRRLVCLCVV